MEEDKGYVYLGCSEDFKDTSCTKIGVCHNIKNRLCTYKTSFSYYGFIPYIIIVCSALNANNIESVLHKELIEDNLWHLNNDENDDFFNGGVEWYKNQYTTAEIDNILDNYNYGYNILTDEELEEFIKNEKKINYKNNKKQADKIKKFVGEKKNKKNNNKGTTNRAKKTKNERNKKKNEKKVKKVYDVRPYQNNIIDYCHNALKKAHKIYLELATGGGKTYIMFKLFQLIKPEFIVIFSPRKKINTQNINEDYLSLLDDDYEKLNMSESYDSKKERFFKSKNKRIVVCCTQSSKNLHKLIIDHKIKNVFVWFDEAHWSFGEWLNKYDDEKVEKYKSEPHRKFWLEDNTVIKNSMFVSASPNKELTKANKHIYGELYNPITVKELIDQGWLCSAVPYHFAYPKDTDDVNISGYILSHFKEDNRRWGFSFHSKQINAFILFYKHFKKYKTKETDIKPYLLVGDDFYDLFKENIDIDKLIKEKSSDIFNEETLKCKREELEKIIKKLKKKYNDVEDFYNNKKLKNIENGYDYKKIDDYEQNTNSIGYVVQRYSIGYDFKGIDYIIIADNKMAYKDIIQCLGRGFRSDTLGENGKNKDKVLHIHVPIYYENDTTVRKYCFKEIKKVLIYLLEAVGINFEELMMKFNKHFTYGLKSTDYKGQEEMKKQIVNLLYDANIFKQLNLKKVYKICIENKIDTLEKYDDFVKDKDNEYLRLKKNMYDYKGFKWKPICDELGKKYYSEKECILRISKLIEEHNLDLDEEENVEKKLNDLDNKIPNILLFRFYGTKNNDCFY